MQAYAKPLPESDPLWQPYWANAKQGRLSVQQCDACGDRHFPAGPVCPVCLSENQHWEPVSGRGAVVSWVVFHRAYWDGFAPDLPYDVCLVRLDEGPLVLANFADGLPSGLKCGLRVNAVFDHVTEEIALLRFSPDEAEA